MKVLAISDHESPTLWDYFDKSRLEGIDVILSCGDLAPEYLSFLVTFFHGPLLYVYGNHDDRYEKTPPDGCICIEDKVFTYQGVRFAGLGGSMRYKKGNHQYTQREMDLRALKLWPRIRAAHGVDVLAAHAPAFGIGDEPGLAHTGFKAFVSLIDAFHPAYFIHGHVHLNYNPTMPRIRERGETKIINAYEKYVFEVAPPQK